MQEYEIDALTFIWHVYFFHVNRALDMPEKLKRWAIDIACPNLLSSLPSALTPDISDPSMLERIMKNQNGLSGVNLAHVKIVRVDSN